MMLSGGSKWSLARLALCACILAALVASRLSPSAFYGSNLHRVIEGDLSSDVWLGKSAEAVVPGFAGGVNFVDLRFKPDRVGASEPARVALSVCGAPESEHTIAGDGSVRLYVPLGCSPLRIAMRSLSFFTPAATGDQRELGVQISSLEVNSFLGMPLVDYLSFALVAAIFLAGGLLVAVVAERIGLSGDLVALVAMLVATLAVFWGDVTPDKWEPLAIVVLALLFGMALYKRGSAVSDPTPGSGLLGGRALLAVALVVGAALRLYGIDFGLPANFHPDEVPKVNAIMRMVDSKSLDPQYFLHPSLLLYLSYGTNTLLHAFGIEGSFRDTAFLAGRLVSASAGLLSIILTYQIGRRLFSPTVGGFAACLLAVFPLHVTCSRYLKEDALLTFVVLSCVLTTIVAVQSDRKWLLLFAGLLAGCTAGTKYSGILMVVVPASAPWMASRRIVPNFSWLPWAVAAVLIAPLGFVATTPYSILNSAKFIKDFDSESRHMQTGHTVSISAWSQLWLYHFWRSIWPGISAVTAVLGCVAAGFMIRRGRIEDLVVLGMALLFYLPAEYVKAKPAPQPERYILPCLPFLAIGVAELVRHLNQRAGTTRKTLALIAAVLAIGMPMARSVSLAKDIKSDTREQLASWMKEHLPAGSKVLMDWKPYCPNFHGEHFVVDHIPRARIILELDVSSLRESGAQYLVLSSLFYNRYFSQPESQPTLRQRFREVFQRVPIIKQFEADSGTYGFHNPTLTLFSLSAEDFAKLDQERAMKVRGQLEYTSNDVRARAKW